MGNALKFCTALAAMLVITGASGQGADPAALLAAQREAMKPLASMNGVWRGQATTQLANGERRSITQTERVGPFLGGTLKVVEGRGYDSNGNVVFNAFGIVSFNPTTQTYSMRSYAMGRQGDFQLKLTDDGYTWEVPAGPGAIIRYAASIKDNRLHEVGDRIVGSSAPTRVFEMLLDRIGDTEWPETGAVSAR
jgi:surface antigen